MARVSISRDNEGTSIHARAYLSYEKMGILHEGIIQALEKAERRDNATVTQGVADYVEVITAKPVAAGELYATEIKIVYSLPLGKHELTFKMRPDSVLTVRDEVIKQLRTGFQERCDTLKKATTLMEKVLEQSTI